jgi:hypothetical protein
MFMPASAVSRGRVRSGQVDVNRNCTLCQVARAVAVFLAKHFSACYHLPFRIQAFVDSEFVTDIVMRIQRKNTGCPDHWALIVDCRALKVQVSRAMMNVLKCVLCVDSVCINNNKWFEACSTYLLNRLLPILLTFGLVVGSFTLIFVLPHSVIVLLVDVATLGSIPHERTWR